MQQFERERERRPVVATDELKDDLIATLGAMRELPSSHERMLIEKFLDRVDESLDARIDARIDQLVRQKKLTKHNPAGVVAAALALAIPLVAVAGGAAGVLGVLFVMVGILALCLAALYSR